MCNLVRQVDKKTFTLLWFVPNVASNEIELWDPNFDIILIAKVFGSLE